MSVDSLSIEEVGRRLVDAVTGLKFLDAIDELYSPDIVSIEAIGNDEEPAELRGIEAIRNKNKWWVENNDLHSIEAKGPFPHGDRFAVFYRMDVTPAAGPRAGQRGPFEEVALYTVSEGKIVREEFFYSI